MKQEVREVISLALLLEEISDFAIFVNYSGHVKKLYVEVAESEENFKDKLFKSEFYIDLPYEKDIAEHQRTFEYLKDEISKATAI